MLSSKATKARSSSFLCSVESTEARSLTSRCGTGLAGTPADAVNTDRTATTTDTATALKLFSERYLITLLVDVIALIREKLLEPVACHDYGADKPAGEISVFKMF